MHFNREFSITFIETCDLQKSSASEAQRGRGDHAVQAKAQRYITSWKSHLIFMLTFYHFLVVKIVSDHFHRVSELHPQLNEVIFMF